MSVAEEKPNVLLVMADQLRGDALSNPDVHMPHLRSLMEHGVSFDNTYSACPSCIAARAGLFTGLSPLHHGFLGYDSEVTWNYQQTLPELFARAGYHTQAVGKMHVEPPRQLMGFHNVILHDGFLHDKRRKYQNPLDYDDYLPWLRTRLGADCDICDAGVGCNGYAARVWPWDERLHPTAWVTDRSIDFLHRRDPSKPFFLKTSYHRPHCPLDPPPTYYQMYEGKTLQSPPTGDWDDFLQHGQGTPENPVPPDRFSQDRARRAYYALISQIDYEFNRLQMALYAQDVGRNTIILFVSDHGDMLFDHGFVRKALPFQGSVRIPLFIYIPPDIDSRWAGRTLHKLAEIRDVMPTLCHLCGIDIPQPIDGLDLLDDAQDRPYLLGMHAYGENTNYYLTDAHEKYCNFPCLHREMLFDLDDDPGETHDLASQRP